MNKTGLSFLLILTFFACSPSAEELLNEGINQLDAKNYREAVEYFDRVITETNENIPTVKTQAHNAKGVALYELGEWDEAIEAFNAAIAIDSTSYKPFFNRGNAYFEQGEFTKAIIDYNYATGLDPEQPDVYYNRGMALLGLESYDDALVDFDKSLQSDPNQPHVLFNKAKAQLGNNDPMGALKSLANTVNLDPNHAAAFYLLGITKLSALEKKEEGCAHLEMALSLGYTGAKEWIDKFCEK